MSCAILLFTTILELFVLYHDYFELSEASSI